MKQLWRTTRTEGAVGVHSPLCLVHRAAESVLMRESYRVCLYVEKHSSSHENVMRVQLKS